MECTTIVYGIHLEREANKHKNGPLWHDGRKGTLLQMSVFTEVFISKQESRHVKGRLLEDGANVILFVESQSNIF